MTAPDPHVLGWPPERTRDELHHQIYTDQLDVVGWESYDDEDALKVRYKYNAAGKDATRSFWLTDGGAREFLNQLEGLIQGGSTQDQDTTGHGSCDDDWPSTHTRDVPYHSIYTDSLDVIGRDSYGGSGAIEVRYGYDAGGVNATDSFWLTDEGAQDFLNQLEAYLNGDE